VKTRPRGSFVSFALLVELSSVGRPSSSSLPRSRRRHGRHTAMIWHVRNYFPPLQHHAARGSRRVATGDGSLARDGATGDGSPCSLPALQWRRGAVAAAAALPLPHRTWMAERTRRHEIPSLVGVRCPRPSPPVGTAPTPVLPRWGPRPPAFRGRPSRPAPGWWLGLLSPQLLFALPLADSLVDWRSH